MHKINPTNIIGGAVFLCAALFIWMVDLEHSLPLNIWQILLIVIASVCYIVFTIRSVREKNWFRLVIETVGLLIITYGIFLLLVPSAA